MASHTQFRQTIKGQTTQLSRKPAETGHSFVAVECNAPDARHVCCKAQTTSGLVRGRGIGEFVVQQHIVAVQPMAGHPCSVDQSVVELSLHGRTVPKTCLSALSSGASARQPRPKRASWIPCSSTRIGQFPSEYQKGLSVDDHLRSCPVLLQVCGSLRSARCRHKKHVRKATRLRSRLTFVPLRAGPAGRGSRVLCVLE